MTEPSWLPIGNEGEIRALIHFTGVPGVRCPTCSPGALNAVWHPADRPCLTPAVTS